MSKRYKKIVLSDGLTVEAPKGKRITFKEVEPGIVKEVIVPKKKKPDVFFRITASKREKVKDWLMKQNPESKRTERESTFLKILSDALEEVDYDYEIATMEPTVVDGKIAYIKGKDVAVGYSTKDWIKMADEYLPERGSRLATLYELFIWYAWRIVKGYWTLHYVAEYSSSAGNYINPLIDPYRFETVGTIKCGGFRDGQGNSYKLVTYKKRFTTVGGIFNAYTDNHPVSNVLFIFNLDEILDNVCGVLVLTK